MNADASPRPVEGNVSWRKDCDCNGTSSTGQFISKEIGRGKDCIYMAVHYYPGPSCDMCGKPWVQANAVLSGAAGSTT